MYYYYSKNINGDNVGIIHFGIGLLGKSIQNNIFQGHFFDTVESSNYRIHWEDNEAIIRKNITNSFESNKALLNKCSRVYVIWSAGKIGFSATNEEANLQLVSFKNIVSHLSFLLKNISVKTKFTLLGSAGGLFEGQISVSSITEPRPIRPYGIMKLNEEEFLKGNDLFNAIEICRISSVYSVNKSNGRKGLVQVLVENGILNKETHIFGDENTLRDYVLDDDIAKYIVSIIFNDSTTSEISFLINGKPSSIFEIRKLIEHILNKKLYIVNSTRKANSKNISFNSNISAKNFHSSNYSANIAKFIINFNR